MLNVKRGGQLLLFLGLVVAGCSANDAARADSQSDGAPPGIGARDASSEMGAAAVPDVAATLDARATEATAADAPPFPNYEPLADGGIQELNLYAGDPPNLRRDAPPETIGDGGRIYSVSIPTVRRYPVNVSQATGIGFIVFPGGGYDHLDMERHATALAARMGPLG